MSKFNAQPGFRSVLHGVISLLLAVLMAGCASKGDRVSALDHSATGEKGYNASVAHAPDADSSMANSFGRSSSNRGGSIAKRKNGGTNTGPNGLAGTISPGSGDSANGQDIADGSDSDADSSMTGGSSNGKGGKAGKRGRRGQGAGPTAGAGSSDDASAAGGGSAGDTLAATDGRAGSAKGKRGSGGRRRGPGGVPGSDGENGAMDSGDEDADDQIGAIDVPNSKVEVNEEYQPLTLGGALPVVLGVNEEGRFDFDQYALRDEVKTILDHLAETLKKAEYDRLDIYGYTDRIGATDYNRRLSELRAYAVAQYLIRKGVPEHKVRYEGRGDRDPLTQAEECQGLGREELITCLQKDRRVEIEASIHRKHATVVQ